MSYSYVVNSQKPTAVQHTIVCNFTSPTDRNLIIAKGNHLEIQTLAEDGLTPILDVGLFGKITALDFYRPANTHQDVIFVLTEKKHFSVIGFDSINKKLVTRAAGNVKDRVGRDIESGQRGFIDPNNSMIAMLLYEGLLKVIIYHVMSTLLCRIIRLLMTFIFFNCFNFSSSDYSDRINKSQGSI